MSVINVAILGASGYGAGELLRLLVQHPVARVVALTSTSQVGASVAQTHAHLRGFYDLSLTESIDLDRFLDAEHAVVFSALPHGASATAVDRLLRTIERRADSEHVKLIDLSGDLRLQNEQIHQQHYPDTPVLSERRECFVYGLPELYREQVRAARFVANPGCLASASILAAAPLITPTFGGVLAIDAKSGSSGSGRALKELTHHPTRHGDFRAYKPLAHQHEPEIRQALGDPTGKRIRTSFVAQSMDVARGIFVTVHVVLSEPTDTAALLERYAHTYRESPFVRIVEGTPSLQNVVGSNFCEISVAVRGEQVIAMAALDNLVKGMSGTAIQNMNLCCGLPEVEGLWSPSFRPV